MICAAAPLIVPFAFVGEPCRYSMRAEPGAMSFAMISPMTAAAVDWPIRLTISAPAFRIASSRRCSTARSWTSASGPLEKISIRERIGSPFTLYAPLVSGDGLTWVSRRVTRRRGPPGSSLCEDAVMTARPGVTSAPSVFPARLRMEEKQRVAAAPAGERGERHNGPPRLARRLRKRGWSCQARAAENATAAAPHAPPVRGLKLVIADNGKFCSGARPHHMPRRSGD